MASTMTTCNAVQRTAATRGDGWTDWLKEFDGKGDAIAYIYWVEKMEAIQDISGCADNQKVKYSVGSLTSRALTWWNSEVRIRGREAAVGM
ncbi:hypothetical protein Tco_0129957, partial [Tanacetum coccineum]